MKLLLLILFFSPSLISSNIDSEYVLRIKAQRSQTNMYLNQLVTSLLQLRKSNFGDWRKGCVEDLCRKCIPNKEFSSSSKHLYSMPYLTVWYPLTSVYEGQFPSSWLFTSIKYYNTKICGNTWQKIFITTQNRERKREGKYHDCTLIKKTYSYSQPPEVTFSVLPGRIKPGKFCRQRNEWIELDNCISEIR